MKTSTRIILCLVGGFALSTSPRAATVEARDHPYKNIPATNVFRLKSPPPRPASKPPEQPPPPKITLQGITTVPGRAHVLFKVMMPARPPEPAKEIPYVLVEGEHEGEIDVLEINEQSGIVTFSNHGVVQVLALER